MVLFVLFIVMIKHYMAFHVQFKLPVKLLARIRLQDSLYFYNSALPNGNDNFIRQIVQHQYQLKFSFLPLY